MGIVVCGIFYIIMSFIILKISIEYNLDLYSDVINIISFNVIGKFIGFIIILFFIFSVLIIFVGSGVLIY